MGTDLSVDNNNCNRCVALAKLFLLQNINRSSVEVPLKYQLEMPQSDKSQHRVRRAKTKLSSKLFKAQLPSCGSVMISCEFGFFLNWKTITKRKMDVKHYFPLSFKKVGESAKWKFEKVLEVLLLVSKLSLNFKWLIWCDLFYIS